MSTELIYGDAVEVKRELGNPTEEEISTSDITAGRRKATRLINGYLEALISSEVPWTTRASVPKLIENIAEDLAVYYIKRMKHPGPAPLDDNTKEEYYDKSIKLLEKIMEGELRIPELSSTTKDAMQANRSDKHTTFDIDEEISQDQSLLDDIAGNRND